MKKIIMLLITVILLTGCEATYDIHIQEDKITDNIKIFTDSTTVQRANEKDTTKYYDKILDWENGYDFYERELFTTDTKTGYHYNYDFNIDEYDAMSQLRKCYDDLNLTVDSYITIKTTNEFLCSTYYPDVNKIKISITSDYRITTSNADEKNGNTHSWLITRKNYKNKPIEIKINKNIPEENKKQEKESIFDLKTILIIIIFILLVIVRLTRGIQLKRNYR